MTRFDFIHQNVRYVILTSNLCSFGISNVKLLGKESLDVDVAVEGMSGLEYATHLHTFIANSSDFSNHNGIHVIKSNPSKCKHLETATYKVYGVDLDFVGLRKEVYTSGNRVPQIVRISCNCVLCFYLFA